MVSSKPKWWLGSTGSTLPMSSQCVTPGIGSTPTISTLSSLKSLSLHRNLSGLFLISGLRHPFSIGFATASRSGPSRSSSQLKSPPSTTSPCLWTTSKWSRKRAALARRSAAPTSVGVGGTRRHVAAHTRWALRGCHGGKGLYTIGESSPGGSIRGGDTDSAHRRMCASSASNLLSCNQN
uniref:Uncharacterized protein n=1 Tax=Oryza glumipatula TaxID=40148 RepID=A0A0E0AKF3_9ORYZ